MVVTIRNSIDGVPCEMGNEDVNESRQIARVVQFGLFPRKRRNIQTFIKVRNNETKYKNLGTVRNSIDGVPCEMGNEDVNESRQIARVVQFGLFPRKRRNVQTFIKVGNNETKYKNLGTVRNNIYRVLISQPD